jgi:cytochrome c oxidase subunit I
MPAHFHQTVAGPVFLAYIGGSLLLMWLLSGREIAFKGLNVWIPYIWTLGIMVFSTGLFIGGVAGEPRRTNMGLSYTNPAALSTGLEDREIGRHARRHHHVHRDLLFFIVFFATLLRKKTNESVLELPVSEPLHDEDVPAVQSFRPWLVAAAILLIVAYTAPFIDLAKGNYKGAPPYDPANPVAESR